MLERYVDPDGHFAMTAGPRSVELWSAVPIRFAREERPEWQQRKDGAVARLHAGLRALRQTKGPRILAGPPWRVNEASTRAQLDPADKWVVAGRLAISFEEGLVTQALSGRLLRVRPR